MSANHARYNGPTHAWMTNRRRPTADPSRASTQSRACHNALLHKGLHVD